MKIQKKLILAIVFIIIILVAGTGVVAYYNGQASLKNAIVNNMRGEAESSLRALQTIRTGVDIEILSIMGEDYVREFLLVNNPDDKTVGEMNDHLAKDVLTYVSYDHFYVLDRNGKVTASSDTRSVGQSYASKKYFIEALGGGIAFSEPFQRDSDKAGVIMSAGPIKNEEEIIGVVFGSLVLQKKIYEPILKPIHIGNTVKAFLLDKNAVVIAAGSDSHELFKPDAPDRQIFSELMTDKDGYKTFYNHASILMEAYFLSSPELGVYIVIAGESTDLYSSLRNIQKDTILAVLLAAIAGTVVVVLFISPITRALRQGVNFSTEIACGNLNSSLSFRRKDELGMLAEALRLIQQSLLQIISEYARVEKQMEMGSLRTKGKVEHFSGEFANLVSGTNRIMDIFTKVLDYIPTPVLMLNSEGKAAFLNQAAITLTTEEYLGKSSAELFRPEDFGTSKCPLQQALLNKVPVFAETIAHPDKKPAMSISYANIPILGTDNRILSILQVITDLSAIKNAQNIIVSIANDTSEIVKHLSVAAEQLSQQSQAVEKATSIQQNRLNSTSKAMEQMNIAVLEVAKSAGAASTQAEEAKIMAQRGFQDVDQVVAAINVVNTAVQSMHQTMAELEVQTNTIGDVMRVISDIADKTNLLALNAAIESARAGEAGRGFSVVAAEVRQLAEDTVQATAEVSTNIHNIQQSAKINMQHMDETSKEAQNATLLAQNSGKSLHEVLTIINSTTDLVGNIAAAAEEQSSTSDEINIAIEEINKIAQETAAGTKESAFSVQELTEMTKQLESLIQKLQQN